MGNYVNWIQQCIPYDVLVSLNVFFCLYYCGPIDKIQKLYTKKIHFFLFYKVQTPTQGRLLARGECICSRPLCPLLEV